MSPTLPPGSVVLSFLSPAEERQLADSTGATISYGREAAVCIKPAAIRLYRELVAEMGAVRCAGAQSVRTRLCRGGATSAWWYHPVALRDAEGAPQFGWIVQILCVVRVMSDLGCDSFRLVGAPDAVRATLARQNTGAWIGYVRRPPWLYAMATRLSYLGRFLRQKWTLKLLDRAPTRRFDIVLQGFWDWSFRLSPDGRGYADRYFKRVPELINQGAAHVGYFAWLDPDFEPSQRGRSLRDILRPLAGRDDVEILQSHLGVGEVLRHLLDFSAYRVLQQAMQAPEFRGVFEREGINWLPLFRPALRDGALNQMIPHFSLVARATARAASAHQPQLSLTFLEHFPHSRAHYAGMRQALPGVENWSMQHAGCGREKTFYFLHAGLEFHGGDDGCSVPHPDRVLVMGELGRAVFLECGYIDAQVVLAGSARYDHIRRKPEPTLECSESASRTNLHILLACSLEVQIEISMVEAACEAARDVEGLHLRLRNHPTSRVDAHRRFARLRGSVEVSANTLADDIAWADIVVYSYSTVAEEALVQGKAVWQWLPLGFNGSALAEAVSIPQFGSVPRLRAAFAAACAGSGNLRVTRSVREDALQKLFAPADGRAAERIAQMCLAQLRAGREHEASRPA